MRSPSGPATNPAPATLVTLTGRVPREIHEIKHDGYRLNLKVFSLEIAEQIIAEHPAYPSL
jgi:hypothetical protein